MSKPDITCSTRTNCLPWPAPKHSHSAAYGRLGQARAGYGRRIKSFLADAPITCSSSSLEFGMWLFGMSRLASCRAQTKWRRVHLPRPSASFHILPLIFSHSLELPIETMPKPEAESEFGIRISGFLSPRCRAVAAGRTLDSETKRKMLTLLTMLRLMLTFRLLETPMFTRVVNVVNVQSLFSRVRRGKEESGEKAKS